MLLRLDGEEVLMLLRLDGEEVLMLLRLDGEEVGLSTQGSTDRHPNVTVPS